MRVSYQHANPQSGRESYLLRFADDIHDQTTCILVDAGQNVDVDVLLDEDEYLSAILLTHAHLDHFQTLGANLRDQASIYTTPETAQAIETRLDTDAEHASLERPDEIRSALEPIDDWTTITSDVRVGSVPAGHAPGACGFAIQLDDGDDTHQLLATGDWTRRRAAGYPGLPTEIAADAVFLTAATSADFERELTEAVGTIVERASAGSTVLATSTGSTGVHLAYLLAHLDDARRPPVTVAGRVATLWEAYEYDYPTVESVPTFDDPDAVLERGGVAIAGPDVPVSGSSGRLFDAIADDGGATLVQLTGGASDPVASATCTVHDYRLSNHPDRATVDAVVEALSPVHVVIMHALGHTADQYKDEYDSYVWATDDDRRYTLYEDGDWSSPWWVTEATTRRVRSRHYMEDGRMVGDAIEVTDVPLPPVERASDVDLAAEGLNVEGLPDVGTTTQPVALADGAAIDPGENDDGTAEPAPDETVSGGHPPGVGERDRAIAEVLSRLDRIEDAVTAETVSATVVDAGDGVTLLRLPVDFDEDLAHGQTVEVALHPVLEDE